MLPASVCALTHIFHMKNMIPSVEGSSTFTYILYTKYRVFVKWTNREKTTEIRPIFGGLKKGAAAVTK